MTHMPKLLFIAGILAAAVLVAGCTTGGNPPPSTNVTAAAPLLLNESMDGSTIAVPVNTTLTLELKENPTTGYAWNLSTTEGLRVASTDYLPDDPQGTRVGAGGVRRWQIEAVATGLQTITGMYARSWENSTANATTYSVEVSVTP